MNTTLRTHLEKLYCSFDYHSRLSIDPVSFVREFDLAEDQELVGLIVSALAYGRPAHFRPKIRLLVDRMNAGDGPRKYIERFTASSEEGQLRGFRYRVTSGGDIIRLFEVLREMLADHGSLEAAFASRFSPDHPDIGSALSGLVDEIYDRARGAGRSFRHLVPSPRNGSACKRLNLYLRWMVRARNDIDPGTWRGIPASHLILPLDTHTLRLSHNLGLTNRTCSSWRTAVEITERLKGLDPADPVKYDFALCHLGMAGRCPRARVRERCIQCVVRGLCRWKPLEE